MKHENIHKKLEELSRNYLAIFSLHKSQHDELHEVSVKQVEKALKSAFLVGERFGYKYGFEDAKQAYECSLEEKVVDSENKMV